MDERLDGWKQLAAYLARDVRTIQRWEHALGLPVHRAPGLEKPHVFALRAEVDAWLLAHLKDQKPRCPSVAVLPFANLSADEENRYFGDGLADDIIDALAGIKGLHV
jgi:hypothetical protein